MSQEFRNCISLIDAIECDLRVAFPGQTGHLTKTEKARGSLTECVGYCVDIGLLPTDGEWFYYKMTGCGWKNGKMPVNDWRSTIRAWKLAGYMASQRNLAMRPKTIIEREVDGR